MEVFLNIYLTKDIFNNPYARKLIKDLNWAILRQMLGMAWKSLFKYLTMI